MLVRAVVNRRRTVIAGGPHVGTTIAGNAVVVVVRHGSIPPHARGIAFDRDDREERAVVVEVSS